MSDSETKKFKVLLLGDGGVGKTTWVKRHRTGEFETKYVPTLGVEVHSIRFFTNRGPITLNIWDCAGQEKFGGLRDGYYIAGQAAIFMFDVTSPTTYQNLPMWIGGVGRVCGLERSQETGRSRLAIPCVIVGNKVDVADRKVNTRETAIPGFHYYDMSAKSSYNCEKPVLDIIRGLLNDDQVILVNAPMPPAAVAVENTLREQSEQHHVDESVDARKQRGDSAADST